MTTLDYGYEWREFYAGRKTTRPNPFERDQKTGQIRSLAGISAISLTDLKEAKRLCQEAGEDPNQWFPNNPL
jgi:hypothetical protein